MMNERDGMFHDDELAALLGEAGSRPDLPRDELDTIRRTARSAWEESVRSNRHRLTRRVVSAAVAAAIGATVLFFFLQHDGRPGDPATTVATVELVKGAVSRQSTEGGKPDAVVGGDVLVGGVTIETSESSWLAIRASGGVALRFDESTRATLMSARKIRLDAGGVYVVTGAKGGESSVEIRTPRGVARDVGTRFEVRVNPETSATVVRVRDGRVVIESRELQREVSAGTELVVERDDRVLVRAVEAWSEEWGWTLDALPPVAIEGRTLFEVLGRLGEETGWEIRFEDAELRNRATGIVLHGSIEDVGPDEALPVLLEGSGMTGAVVDGVLVVRRSR